MIAFAAVTRECCHPIGQPIVIGHKASSIPVGAQVFARIKGEGRNVAKGSHKLSVVAGQMRLGAIFYHPQIMLSCDRHDRAHVRWLSIKMNRNDADGGRRDLSFDVDGINGKCFSVRVAKHDSAARLRDGLRC